MEIKKEIKSREEAIKKLRIFCFKNLKIKKKKIQKKSDKDVNTRHNHLSGNKMDKVESQREKKIKNHLGVNSPRKVLKSPLKSNFKKNNRVSIKKIKKCFIEENKFNKIDGNKEKKIFKISGSNENLPKKIEEKKGMLNYKKKLLKYKTSKDLFISEFDTNKNKKDYSNRLSNKKKLLSPPLKKRKKNSNNNIDFIIDENESFRYKEKKRKNSINLLKSKLKYKYEIVEKTNHRHNTKKSLTIINDEPNEIINLMKSNGNIKLINKGI